MKIKRFEGQKSVKVIVYEVHGGNFIFNSMNECAEYFRELGQNSLYAETVARKIVDGTSWGYTETYFLNGERKTEHHEFFFDELSAGDFTTAVNTGNVPIRRNKPTARKMQITPQEGESPDQLYFWN